MSPHSVLPLYCYVTVNITSAILQSVSKKYNKTFDFLKQYLSQHVIDDIWRKDSMQNTITRPDEEFI